MENSRLICIRRASIPSSRPQKTSSESFRILCDCLGSKRQRWEPLRLQWHGRRPMNTDHHRTADSVGLDLENVNVWSSCGFSVIDEGRAYLGFSACTPIVVLCVIYWAIIWKAFFTLIDASIASKHQTWCIPFRVPMSRQMVWVERTLEQAIHYCNEIVTFTIVGLWNSCRSHRYTQSHRSPNFPNIEEERGFS